jgi:hypothetical protein
MLGVGRPADRLALHPHLSWQEDEQRAPPTRWHRLNQAASGPPTRRCVPAWAASPAWSNRNRGLHLVIGDIGAGTDAMRGKGASTGLALGVVKGARGTAALRRVDTPRDPLCAPRQRVFGRAVAPPAAGRAAVRPHGRTAARRRCATSRPWTPVPSLDAVTAHVQRLRWPVERPAALAASQSRWLRCRFGNHG